MIARLALRTLLMHPIRTAVLAGGFGLGVAVMANLLGVAEVVLEQSQSPALVGGGDVVVTGAASRLTSGRYLLWGGLGAPAFAGRITAASPTRRGSVFLVQDGVVTRLRARGGIPSLERALEDPETAGVSAWVDAPGDASWTAPDPKDVLRSLDRFHAIPDVPARAGSWVEWLYFNGQAGSTRFYLTFLVGPMRDSGRRAAGVRLQLDRAGIVENYSEAAEIDPDEVLATAPEITIGRSRVRLDGDRYIVSFDLREAGRGGRADGTVQPPALGERRGEIRHATRERGPGREDFARLEALERGPTRQRRRSNSFAPDPARAGIAQPMLSGRPDPAAQVVGDAVLTARRGTAGELSGRSGRPPCAVGSRGPARDDFARLEALERGPTRQRRRSNSFAPDPARAGIAQPMLSGRPDPAAQAEGNAVLTARRGTAGELSGRPGRPPCAVDLRGPAREDFARLEASERGPTGQRRRSNSFAPDPARAGIEQPMLSGRPDPAAQAEGKAVLTARRGTAGEQSRRTDRPTRAQGEIVLTARRGHSLPPLSISGARGWVSGYVVPVMSGALDGTIRVGEETLPLAGGTGYHDHNWGFWEGVSWQWGQVQHEGLSILYGRVFPPADAADASRVPGFMMVLGPDGALGQATRVTIDETIAPTLDRPARIIVRGNSPSLDLRMEIDVESAIRTPWRTGPLANDLDFLQMRGRYRVTGKAGDRALDFTAPGAAETFRGR